MTSILSLAMRLMLTTTSSFTRTVSKWSSIFFGLTEAKAWVCFLRNYPTAQELSALNVRRSGNQSIESEWDYELMGQELRRWGDRALETSWNAVTNKSTGNLLWNAIRAQKIWIQRRNLCFSLFTWLMYLVLVHWREKRRRIY